MSAQFKFEKQNLEFDYLIDVVTPEQVIMMGIQQRMRFNNKRSFASYLKYIDVKRIERTSISLTEIADLLNVPLRYAEYIAVEWMNSVGGSVVQHAGINAYYLKDVYEIIN